jgi:hypothetical protein
VQLPGFDYEVEVHVAVAWGIGRFLQLLADT